LAIWGAYRAAYGLPVTLDLSNDEKIAQWFRDQQGLPERIGDQLRASVIKTVIGLALIAAVVGIQWFAPREIRSPTVKATQLDGSFVCGRLLSSTTDSQFRVRRSDGTVEAVPAANTRQLAVVESC
jgi:ABC-type phosphate transport system auxiliary subunit